MIDTGTSAVNGESSFEFMKDLWRFRWTVLAITAATLISGIAYAFLAKQWFKAEIVLSPASKPVGSGVLSQFGGFASLAGINIDAGSDNQVPIAVLRSRSFATSFIERNHLLEVLLPDEIDSSTGKWKELNPDKQPDIRDALKVFDEKVRSVAEDKKNGLVTLSIKWTNSALAAAWANEMILELNLKLRAQAEVEAERNISYLQRQIGAATVAALQQSLGKVLEAEMQKLLIAKGNDEFAFKVIDPAIAPKKRTYPNRIAVIFGSAIFGFFVSVLSVLVIRERGGTKISN